MGHALPCVLLSPVACFYTAPAKLRLWWLCGPQRLKRCYLSLSRKSPWVTHFPRFTGELLLTEGSHVSLILLGAWWMQRVDFAPSPKVRTTTRATAAPELPMWPARAAVRTVPSPSSPLTASSCSHSLILFPRMYQQPVSTQIFVSGSVYRGVLPEREVWKLPPDFGLIPQRNISHREESVQRANPVRPAPPDQSELG
jgi:hypothetical protein